MNAASPIEEISRVRGSGGRELIVHRTIPREGARASVLLLHGIQSHAGWYLETRRSLAAAGIEVACPERRGSGVDRRDRGDAPSANALLEDARSVADHLARSSGHPPTWVGVSWGAKLAYLAAQQWPGDMAGLALVVPGLFPHIRMPVRDRARVAVLAFLGGRFPVDVPLGDPALFSSIPRFQELVASDPLALHRATARFLVASQIIDTRIQRLERRLDPALKVLLVLAEADRIVDNRATERFLRWRVGEGFQTLRCPTAAHTPEFSADAAIYQERLRRFCLEGAGS